MMPTQAISAPGARTSTDTPVSAQGTGPGPGDAEVRYVVNGPVTDLSCTELAVALCASDMPDTREPRVAVAQGWRFVAQGLARLGRSEVQARASRALEIGRGYTRLADRYGSPDAPAAETEARELDRAEVRLWRSWSRGDQARDVAFRLARI